jgi:hypothetical protein
MEKASWAGSLMVPHQISYEAPPIWVILQTFFSDKSTYELDDYIVTNKTGGIAKSDYLKFKAYAASFFSTNGNYHHYGSKKYIPEVNSTTFKAILQASPLYKTNSTKAIKYQ